MGFTYQNLIIHFRNFGCSLGNFRSNSIFREADSNIKSYVIFVLLDLDIYVAFNSFQVRKKEPEGESVLSKKLTFQKVISEVKLSAMAFTREDPRELAEYHYEEISPDYIKEPSSVQLASAQGV